MFAMRYHYPRSRRTLLPAALRKADGLTFEITCTAHVITSLRYFSPLLLPPRCASWASPINASNFKKARHLHIAETAYSDIADKTEGRKHRHGRRLSGMRGITALTEVTTWPGAM